MAVPVVNVQQDFQKKLCEIEEDSGKHSEEQGRSRDSKLYFSSGSVTTDQRDKSTGHVSIDTVTVSDEDGLCCHESEQEDYRAGRGSDISLDYPSAGDLDSSSSSEEDSLLGSRRGGVVISSGCLSVDQGRSHEAMNSMQSPTLGQLFHSHDWDPEPGNLYPQRDAERLSLDSFASNVRSEEEYGYPRIDLDTIDSGFVESDCSSPVESNFDSKGQSWVGPAYTFSAFDFAENMAVPVVNVQQDFQKKLCEIEEDSGKHSEEQGRSRDSKLYFSSGSVTTDQRDKSTGHVSIDTVTVSNEDGLCCPRYHESEQEDYRAGRGSDISLDYPSAGDLDSNSSSEEDSLLGSRRGGVVISSGCLSVDQGRSHEAMNSMQSPTLGQLFHSHDWDPEPGNLYPQRDAERLSLDSFASNVRSEEEYGYPRIDLDTIDSGFVESDCSSPVESNFDSKGQIPFLKLKSIAVSQQVPLKYVVQSTSPSLHELCYQLSISDKEINNLYTDDELSVICTLVKEAERFDRVSYSCSLDFEENIISDDNYQISLRRQFNGTIENTVADTDYKPSLHIKPLRPVNLSFTLSSNQYNFTWDTGYPDHHYLDDHLQFELSYKKKEDPMHSENWLSHQGDPLRKEEELTFDSLVQTKQAKTEDSFFLCTQEEVLNHITYIKPIYREWSCPAKHGNGDDCKGTQEVVSDIASSPLAALPKSLQSYDEMFSALSLDLAGVTDSDSGCDDMTRSPDSSWQQATFSFELPPEPESLCYSDDYCTLSDTNNGLIPTKMIRQVVKSAQSLTDSCPLAAESGDNSSDPQDSQNEYDPEYDSYSECLTDFSFSPRSSSRKASSAL
ncbi:UNVERIFIED_CONTAM: hypothetical protein FKN15_008453 [Acipenser sinensis]